MVCVVVAPLLVRADAIVPAQNGILVRAIAIFMAAAWALLAVQHGLAWVRRGLRRVARSPAILAGLAVTATTLLAASFSVSPAISWWGSLNRRDGGFTDLAYLVVFASAGYCIRRRDQVVRLMDLLTLASLPITFYALLQRAGADPLPWTDDATRLSSTLANPDFLGAWLILAIPMTAWGLYLTLRHEQRRDWGRIGVYAGALVLQLLVLDFTAARGATLGLLGGAAAAGLALAAARGRRLAVRVGLAFILLGSALLVVLNLPLPAVQPLRSLPVVERFAHVLDSSDGSSQVRLLLWRSSLRLLGPHAPLVDAEGRSDWPWPVRDAVGYGPESTIVVSEAVMPPELAHFERPLKRWDRAHNETFDLLLTRGALGLIAFLALFGALLWLALGRLVCGPWPSPAVFSLLYAAGGLAGAGMSLVVAPVFFGLAVPFGCLLGFLVYLAFGPWAARGPADAWRWSLTLALLCALVAHFVEIQFGIEVLPSAVSFWILAGLLLAVTPAGVSSQPPAPDAGRPLALSLGAAAVTLCALIVGADFLIWPSDAHSVPAALELSLTRGSGLAPSLGILETLLLVLLAGVLLWSGGKERRTSVLVVAPPGAWLAFALGRLWLLQPQPADAGVAARLAGLSAAALVVPLATLVLLVGMCGGCTALWGAGLSVPRRTLLGAAPLVLLACLAISLTTGRQAQAEVLARLGNSAQGSAQLETAAYAEAAALAPFDAYTHMLLGDADLAHGDSASGHAELRFASRLNPFDASPAGSLAREALATGAVADADKHWAVVAALMPRHPDTWLAWAAIKARRGDYVSALAFLQRAFELDPEFERTYDTPGSWPRNPPEIAQAVENYRSSAAGPTFAGRLVVGSVDAALRDCPAAVDAYQAALAMLPADVDPWAIHRALAGCYKNLGDASRAESEKALAVSLARPIYPVSDLQQ